MNIAFKYGLLGSSVFLTFLLGVFVISHRKTLPHIMGFLLCMMNATVTFLLLRREWLIDQNRVPLPWNNFFDAGLALQAFTAFSFSLSYPSPRPQFKKILLLVGGVAAVVAVFAANGALFSKHRVVDKVHIIAPTGFYYIYLVYILSTMIATIGVLYKNYTVLKPKGEDTPESKGLRVIIIGFFLSTIVAFFVTYVMPVLFSEIRFFYFLSLAFVIGSTTVFFSIVQYRAFDIETVVHKTLSWALLSCGPLAIGVTSGFVLKSRISALSSWQMGLSIGGIGSLIGLYLYLAQPYIDQLFDRRKYDLQKALDHIISDLAVLQELRPMSENIVTRVSNVLSLVGGSVFVTESTQAKLQRVFTQGITIDDTIALAPQLSVALTKSVEGESDTTVQAWVQRHGFALSLAFVQNQELLGVLLLGRKRNLRHFSKRETAFLKQVNTAMTIALSNSLLYERLRELDQQKTKFLTEVAHELSGPLSGMTSIAEGLLGKRDEASTAVLSDEMRNIESIRVTAAEMKDLVDNLLDLSKVEIGAMTYHFQKTDLATVVQTAIDLARPAARRKNLDLDFEYDTPFPEIVGDKARLRQCVSNLITNAIKYTDFGKIHVLCQRQDDEVFVKVRDTGRGMSPDEMEMAFKRYQRGQKTHEIEGSGLGLALTQEIIVAHGGRITLESKLEVGSEFTFYLSATSEPPIHTNPATYHPLIRTSKVVEQKKNAPQLESFRGSGERILVIDDSEADRTPIQSYLQKQGYEVQTAGDGKEGHQLCLLEPPDLILTDMMMPRISGSELCRLLKRDPTTASIPIIMITGRNNFGDMIFGIQMGADDYIAKPCNPEELLLRITALLRMRRIRDERDIANRKLTETDLIATSASAIVHALKSPVVVIRNYVKWVQEALEGSNVSTARQRLLGIDESAATISRFIDSLKRTDFSAPEVVAIDLSALLDQVLAEQFTRFPVSKYQLEKRYEQGLKPIMGDQKQLAMAFANLIQNALEAQADGGRVGISVFSEDQQNNVVSIRDWGPGIASEMQEELFKPFRTNKAHGTGLGLWVSKRILETNHPGQIEIESSATGTEVRVKMPLPFNPIPSTGNQKIQNEKEQYSAH